MRRPSRLSLTILPAALVAGFFCVVALVRADDRPGPLDCTGEKGVSAAEVKKAQEAWAKFLGRQVEEEDEIVSGVKMKFVLVPPGKFLMGSPKDEKWREGNEALHEVEITKPFWLGKYEVTQEQYRSVTGKNPSKFQGADRPVEEIVWEEADAFARKLTDKTSKLLYRLPTEAEWEYACRGGRPSSQPFGVGDGKALSSAEANFNGNNPYGGADKGKYLEKTAPVGSFKPNALGLYDMHGNVEEWCADWYAAYPSRKVSDPAGPDEGNFRVFRGGGWESIAVDCRAANRSHFEPSRPGPDLGFRLARVPSEK
jgi:formylglycine-generating enzyme required for sulfatase activity